MAMAENRDTITAHHEAAHAVISYRVAAHAGSHVSIVPDEDTLGGASDVVSDSHNPQHMEADILSRYAGGHAQRRIDPTCCGDDGCGWDDETARKALWAMGWKSREDELRTGHSP